MKNLILTTTAIVLAMTFFAGHVLAQEATGLVNYGAQVGLNLANASGSDATRSDADKKFRMGVNAGFFATYAFTDMFAIQPEFLYSMKGVKYQAKVGDTKLTEKVDYIDIPILLKVSPKMAGNIKPSLLVGPFIGFKAGAKYSFSGTVPEGQPSSGTIENVSSTAFGVSLGAEVGMKMTKGMPYLGVNYALGLSKVFKKVDGVQSNVKANVISISLGYAFK